MEKNLYVRNSCTEILQIGRAGTKYLPFLLLCNQWSLYCFWAFARLNNVRTTGSLRIRYKSRILSQQFATRAMSSAPSERAPLLAAGTPAGKAAAPTTAFIGKRTPTMRHLIRMLPPSVAGLALGVCGLGITWQTAADYLAAGQSVRIVADVRPLTRWLFWYGRGSSRADDIALKLA